MKRGRKIVDSKADSRVNLALIVGLGLVLALMFWGSYFILFTPAGGFR